MVTRAGVDPHVSGHSGRPVGAPADGATGSADAADPVAGWVELLAHPAVVERAEVAGPVGVMAVHGGLEEGTAEIARAAAAVAGCSLYLVVQPPDLRRHVPSVGLGPSVSPRLASWLGCVERVISLHGYGRRGRPRDLLVGGADRAVVAAAAVDLRTALPTLAVVDDPARIPEGLTGRHPANPVNLPPRGGVQLELPLAARRDPLAGEVAAAVAALAGRWSADR